MTARRPIRDLAESAAFYRARAADEALSAARQALIELPNSAPMAEWDAAKKRIRKAETETMLALAVLLSEIDSRARVEAQQ